ncbi:MAG: cellulase family glycosylhydrolase [Saccharofermentanales bacterium]
MKKAIRLLSVVLALALLMSFPVFQDRTSAVLASQDPSMTLYQRGNELVNEAGQSVRLLGTNVPQLGWSITGENRGVFNILDLALGEWESNVIRLAVKPALWFDANQQARDNYRGMVDEIIEIVAQEGKYLLLDNHSFYQPGTPDLQFWQDAAARYKDRTNVIFGLFNEPTSVSSWAQWANGGGEVTVNTDEGQIVIQAVGHQQILDAIRETGAKNVVTISGRDWGYDLRFALDEAYRIEDNGGNGIIYEIHPYPERTRDYPVDIGHIALEYPIVVGELGPTYGKDVSHNMRNESDQAYMADVLKMMEDYEVNLTAWALGAWPHLIDTGTKKPTKYGELILDFIKTNQAHKSVTLYEDADMTGNSVSLLPGKYTAGMLEDLGFDLSGLSSVDSKRNIYQYLIHLYENADFTGKHKTVLSATQELDNLDLGFTPASVVIEKINPVNMVNGNVKKVNVSGSSETAEQMVDGSINSQWAYTSAGGDQTVIIELDKPIYMSNLRVYHAGAAGELSVFNTYDFSVSVSTHGNVFKRVADYKHNMLNVTEARFDQVIAKYIKIIVKSGSFLEPETAKIAEVQAFGALYDGTLPDDPYQLSTSGSESSAPSSSASVSTPAPTQTPVSEEVSSDEESSEEPSSEVESSEPESSEDISSAESSEVSSSVSSQPEDEGEGGTKPIVIVVIALAAAALIAASVLIFIKKRK